MRSVLCSCIAVVLFAQAPAYAGCPETNTGQTTYTTLEDIQKNYCGAPRAPTADEGYDPSTLKMRDCKAYVEIIVGYDIVVGKPAEGLLRNIETTKDGPLFHIQWIENNRWYKGVYASIDATPALIDRMFFYDLKKDARAACFAKAAG